MKKSFYYLIFSLFFASSLASFAQKKSKKGAVANAVASADTLAKSAKPKEKKEEKGPKAFDKFIDSTFTAQKGIFNVYFKDEKYYFEIPHSLLNKEMIAITRYSKTAAGGGIFGGEEVNKQVVKWEKGNNNSLFLRSITYVITSPDSTKPMFQAVKNSNSAPIVGTFEIKAWKKGSQNEDSPNENSSYVIDVTSFFAGDEQVVSLDPVSKQLLKIASFKKEASFIEKIRTYPINTEIRTVKTFAVTPPRLSLTPTPEIGVSLPAGVDAGVVTMEFNTSFILLPEVPMRKRAFDYRVGFFANQYALFKEESQQAEKEVFAVRWRLEPKNAEDAEKQRKGELIEPQKPIVYYIDPATPQKWRSYLKQGVDDWNIAFEAAGWKNAIRGEYWPENDSTMSLEDARFSVIRYFAADIQNAYGPNVHDPRSGEILESHVGWYHNVMRLLRNWYMIQTAAVDPRARNKDFSDELMGQLIRFVSSHEIGHTLGLRHNMGASSATPVEKLRDKEWIAKNGHTSSIMDYARFNYVAQPEDGVTDLFPRIGDYDIWAIKWGYSFIEKDEKTLLNDWTKEAYKNPRLRFGTEVSPYDPRYQTEDLGDNAMRASDYGIRNLKRILPNLKDWSKENGESYQELDELYGNVVGQFRRYIGHVTKNIGGIYDTPTTYDMAGNAFSVVPKSTQKEAVSFLNNQLFSTPYWLVNEDVLAKIKPEMGVEAIKSLQEFALSSIFAGDRFVRLLESNSVNSSNYSVDELLSDLENGLFSELKTKPTLDIYRRNVQKVYVNQLIAQLTPPKTTVRSVPVGVTYGFSSKIVDLSLTDLPSIARGHLENLKSDIKIAISKSTDKVSSYHLKDLVFRIEKALDPK